MPDYGTTAKHALRKLLGTSQRNEIDEGIGALADDLDAIIAVDDQGPEGSRPTSTSGSPGKAGRYYFATDTRRLFRDHGTGWDEIQVGEIATADIADSAVTAAKIAANAVTAAKIAANQVGPRELSRAFALPPEVAIDATPGATTTNYDTGNIAFTTKGNRQLWRFSSQGWRTGGADVFLDLIINGTLVKNAATFMTDAPSTRLENFHVTTFAAGTAINVRMRATSGHNMASGRDRHHLVVWESIDA